MENLMLISLSLSSLLSFLSYCFLLSLLNFFAFCVDYGLVLSLVHRYPLSTLPRFMWSARMGYPVPFTLSLTELTFVSYLTVYTVNETVSCCTPSLWPVYFLVFLVQRICRLLVLLRSPTLLHPSHDFTGVGDQPSEDHARVTQSLCVEHSCHKAISLALCILCFVVWVHVCCVLHWVQLVHHELVCQSFLVCIYMITLIQSVDGLLTHLRAGCISAQFEWKDSAQLNLPRIFLHLIPASLLPYVWSPLSGPARFQWVAELFVLLFVHLFDRYHYDYHLSGLDVPLPATKQPQFDRSIYYCALCLRPRHRPLVSFASQLDPSEPALPCTHPVHQACYRIWQAIAPYCTRCKELKALVWLKQKERRPKPVISTFDRTDATTEEDGSTTETENGQESSRSWSSDSLDRVSSLLSSSSDLSVYDDKDIDLQVYLDRWTDVERGAHSSSSAPAYGDSSSSDGAYDADGSTPPQAPLSPVVDQTVDCFSLPSSSDAVDPVADFWLPSG